MFNHSCGIPSHHNILNSNKSVNINTTQGFEPRTTLPFIQSTAPTGWIKDTSHHNKALRVVNTAGGGIGGTIPFTDTFSTVSILGSVGETTLTIDQMPSHTHEGAAANQLVVNAGTLQGATLRGTCMPTGGDQPHDHPLTLENINLSVQYIDVILCKKI